MSIPADSRWTFCPGSPNRIDSGFPVFKDAADDLKSMKQFLQVHRKGILLTADGGRYEGELFGAPRIAHGELVFTTGMMGYQESLTDPSFAGQVLTFTYPLIGNYGIHRAKSESSSVWPTGVVVRHAMEQPDHRDSIGTVDELLRVQMSQEYKVSTPEKLPVMFVNLVQYYAFLGLQNRKNN